MFPLRKKTGPKPPKTTLAKAFDWFQVIAIALALSFIIRVELVSAYVIPSGSMIPTLKIGDRVMVNKLSYGLRNPFTGQTVLGSSLPERGDIVVFDPPFDSPDPYIKRVIGLPGDVVAIRGKILYVNGSPVDDNYAFFSDKFILPPRMSRRDNFGPVTVPPDKLFMMGDNRDGSNDSRFWGFADVAQVKGRAMFILWSWDQEQSLPRWSRILSKTQ